MGLLCGAFLAVVALTGSLLALEPLLLRLEHGDRIEASAPYEVSPDDFDRWADEAVRQRPDISEIHVIAAPKGAPVTVNVALVVATASDQSGQSSLIGVSIDPATDAATGSFDFFRSPTMLVRAVHYTLVIPFFGSQLVAAIGVITILSLLSGLYVFWPRRGTLKRSLKVRRLGGVPRDRQRHILFGFWSFPILLIVTFSGVWWAAPYWIDPVVSAVAPISQDPDHDALSMGASRDGCGEPKPISDVVSLALEDVPGSSPSFVLLDSERTHPVEVRVRRGVDINQRFGDTSLWIDPSCLTILYRAGGEHASSADRIKASMPVIHSGKILGIWGEVLVFLSGLTTVLLIVTGTLYWLKRPKRIIEPEDRNANLL
jgi:uncharacterized iron-regulated membrane protein